MCVLGRLDYDKNVFETVKESDIILADEWFGLVYNEDTGIFVVERTSNATSPNEKVFTVILKTKKEITDAEVGNINIYDNMVSEGKGDLVLADAMTSVNLKAVNNENDNAQNESDANKNINNTKSENDTSKNNNVESENNISENNDDKLQNDTSNNNIDKNVSSIEKLKQILPNAGNGSYKFIKFLIVVMIIIVIIFWIKNRKYKGIK